MNKIGIRAHDIGKFNPLELASKVSDYGFDGVQLVFKKALIEPIDLEAVKSAFSDLHIMMLGAYFNPIHPKYDQVVDGISYFKDMLCIANELGVTYVGSETGSLMGQPWGYVKENHSLISLKQVTNVFKELAQYAKLHHSCVAVEGAYNHVACDPERVKYIVDQINSPNIKVTIDLFNFLNIENYKQRMNIFEDALRLLKNHIVIFHLKDFVIENKKIVQVGLGQGLMDYPQIIKRIKEEVPNAYLIFEGVVGDDIETSFEFIKKLLEGK